jgi:hypothetical protein
MSRKGTCLDNAAMEEFFSHLKEEWFRIQKPGTLGEFHVGLTDYLHWLNAIRVQQRLGYLSPGEYRAHTTAIAYCSINMSSFWGPSYYEVNTSPRAPGWPLSLNTILTPSRRSLTAGHAKALGMTPQPMGSRYRCVDRLNPRTLF